MPPRIDPQDATNASETTRLLPPAPTASPAPKKRLVSPLIRLYLITLLLSTSFMCTSTTLIYAFRMIICDEQLGKGGDGGGFLDRCSMREVDARSAREVSYMVTLTTISGCLNLFSTGWLTRKFGVRFSMFFQTFWPSVRVLCQLWGIVDGTMLGVRVIQLTQLITILGGGAGYILCVNTFAAVLVSPEERTATFGRLQGLQAFGTALGLVAGGYLGDRFGLPAPFIVAFALLALSTIISGLFLPYIPPASPDESAKSSTGGGFFSPLKIFTPRLVWNGEKETRWYGLFFIGLGSFVSTFATSTIQILLQLISTAAFGFGPKANGALMSLAALSRAGFLTLLFPHIIAFGRKLYSSPTIETLRTHRSQSEETETPPDHLPDSFAEIQPIQPPFQNDSAIEPPRPPVPTDEQHGSAFDLAFLRGSILIDAVLTGCIGFAQTGWHLYLAALVIPLASGTAPASKGVVMEMVSPSEQADALQGIALIETLAMTLTVSVFGAIFAGLSELGRPFDVFFLNAALALVAGVILQFARFPPKNRSSSV
ncbi:hypothetical protein JCM16303_000095 [Sporobolomyces ruberrimus]